MKATTSTFSETSILSRPSYLPSTQTDAFANDEEVRHRYHDIINEPRYQHFARIPDRIIQCLDYFGVGCDRRAVRERLLAYYLFIGVVDDAIDSGQPGIAQLIFERFSTPLASSGGAAANSDVAIVTEILKTHLDADIHTRMVEVFKQAYQEGVSERAATSIKSYVEHRKALGRLTAEQSYLFIGSLLQDDGQSVCRFMQDVGAVGCLVDSVIDLRQDSRMGLISFRPTAVDFTKLSFWTLSEGLRVWSRHVRLSGIFFAAVVDNLRDLSRRKFLEQRPAPIEGKDHATSVA